MSKGRIPGMATDPAWLAFVEAWLKARGLDVEHALGKIRKTDGYMLACRMFGTASERCVEMQLELAARERGLID